MAVKVSSVDCPSCGFPILAGPGQTVSCANCGITGRISGVEIPSGLFWGTICFVAGLVIRPYLIRQVGRVR